jgi:hypothetical protein
MRTLAAVPLRIAPLAALALLLTGCVIQVPFDRDARTDTPDATAPATPRGDAAPDCDGGELLVTEPGSDVELRGECASVRIEGTDITVDGGSIGTLVVRGDRNEADFDDIDTITVEGTENEVDLDNGGSVTIRGDRNSVDADTLGAISINGFDNEIDADTVGPVDDSGERNRIDAD